MVDVVDIPRINALLDEQARIDQAIRIIEDRGRITEMTLTSNPESGFSGQVAVPTQYMRPPEVMYDTLASLMRDRSDQIYDELRDLGVTGDSR